MTDGIETASHYHPVPEVGSSCGFLQSRGLWLGATWECEPRRHSPAWTKWFFLKTSTMSEVGTVIMQSPNLSAKSRTGPTLASVLKSTCAYVRRGRLLNQDVARSSDEDTVAVKSPSYKVPQIPVLFHRSGCRLFLHLSSACSSAHS